MGRDFWISRYSAESRRARFSRSGSFSEWRRYPKLLRSCALRTSRGSTPSAIASAVAVSRSDGSRDFRPATVFSIFSSMASQSTGSSKSSSSPPASSNASSCRLYSRSPSPSSFALSCARTVRSVPLESSTSAEAFACRSPIQVCQLLRLEVFILRDRREVGDHRLPISLVGGAELADERRALGEEVVNGE